MSRSCARPGCSRTADATMSYTYADSTVLLEPLVAESHPMLHDLCGRHAASVRVPRGWLLEDRWSETHRVVDAVHDRLDLIGA